MNWFFTFCLGLFLGLIFGLALCQDKINLIRADAIKHGSAEWRIDSQTGTVEFHWLSAKSER